VPNFEANIPASSMMARDLNPSATLMRIGVGRWTVGSNSCMLVLDGGEQLNNISSQMTKILEYETYTDKNPL
jgi:hypothetical protein